MYKVFGKAILLLIIAFLCLLGPAYAASMTDEAVLGNNRFSVTSSGDLIPGSDNAYDIGSSSYEVADIYYNGALIPGTSSSLRTNTEVFTTGDTLVAADSGKCIITYAPSVSSNGIIDFVLPTVAAGEYFKFVAGSTNYIRIDPYGTQAIMYSTNVVGDRIESAGASADSVTLVSDGTRWYVSEMKGTWTDAN